MKIINEKSLAGSSPVCEICNFRPKTSFLPIFEKIVVIQLSSQTRLRNKPAECLKFGWIPFCVREILCKNRPKFRVIPIADFFLYSAPFPGRVHWAGQEGSSCVLFWQWIPKIFVLWPRFPNSRKEKKIRDMRQRKMN